MVGLPPLGQSRSHAGHGACVFGTESRRSFLSVTTDIGVTLFIFLAVYLLWEYVNRPTWWLLVATGISTGMALLSKFSAVLLIPMIALIVAASVLIGSERHVLLPLKRNPK